MCRVGDAVLPAICGPLHCDVSSRRQGKQTQTRGLCFQGRTCISWHCVCDIWGTTELRANNILIGFFGLNVFSGGCSWWCHLTHQLSCCCSIIEVKWANGKHRVRHAEDGEKERCMKRQSWQTEGVMNEETERWKPTVTVEDSGFNACTCTRIVKHIPRSWQPMCEVKTAESREILSSKMIYSPCQIQWKQNWVSVMKYIITTGLMNQKAVWGNMGYSSKS